MEATAAQHQPYTPSEAGFWRVTIALMLASLSIFSTLYVFQPLLPVFTSELDITATQSSLLMSACVTAMVFGLFILGFAADRYGRALVMRGSLLFTALSLVLIPIMPEFEWMVTLRFIQGFFLAGIPAAAMGYLGEEVSYRHIGLAMTLYISSNALGGMGGRVVGGYLTDLFNWQMTLWSFSAFGVLAAFLFLWLFPKERFFEKAEQNLVVDLKGMLIHLKSGPLLVLFLLGILMQIVFTAVWTYLPFYLEGDPFDWPLKWIAFTYFAYLFGVLAPPAAGRISDQAGLKRVMFSGVVIFLIGTALTAVKEGWSIMVGLSLLCMGFFVAHSMASALVSKTATHHRSGASGFYLISYYLGVAIGSTAVGTLWEKFQWYGVLSVGFLLIVLFILYPFYKDA
ncbi:MFS transporter [Halobacillus kuroshimensis]|uniref:MFS transporter n=1 Tax=Halobacillus kuroshimensis TaxID=302481 RepID=A0ABS3DX06_9BACI|nr:MFS transporter [Halobacillus kuroshimensis]MBN8235877.1 MFS transporter [Halobacillus kuroshimensis]